MEPKIYKKMADLEDSHWWFVARRRIIDTLITNLVLPDNAAIFEAGCGTGGNLAMLAGHGQVYAMELDEAARRFACDLGVGKILPGRLPDDIPFEDQSFDLIVLLDVLEHLDKDTASLQALYSRLKPGGWLLVTVPANPWMWSQHDESHHHKRRYVLRGLRHVVRSAGYTVRYVSYFNTLLFPLIAGVRILQNCLGSGQKDNLTMPSKQVNQVLTFLFASERYLMGRVPLPFGVSLLLLAQNVK